MGYVHAKIELSNPRQPDLKPIPVEAQADTGALMLCIPEHLALQLNLQQESEREVTVADGRSMNVPYVGPLKVSFQARICAEEQERGLHRFWAWREQQLQLVEANASDVETASRLCAQNQPPLRPRRCPASGATDREKLWVNDQL